MQSPFTRLSRTPPIIWVSLLCAVLILVGAGFLGAFTRSQQPAPEPPPQVVVQVIPTASTTNPTFTPRPLLPSETSPAILLEPVETPAPLPTDTVPPPTLEPTATEPLPTATEGVPLQQPTVTTPPPTARASNDPNLLPNGVRYGERKPNLPGRIVRI